MDLLVQPAKLRGAVTVPGSKSHSIRGVLLASLAPGESRLEAPLTSADTEAAVRVYTALGARCQRTPEVWTIRGIGPDFAAPAEALDVGNSGTTMNMALGTCALLREGQARLTGDEQIRRRPSRPLAEALQTLGAEVVDERGTGCPPYRVRGRLRGGRVRIECRSSQYLSSLLLACPLAAGDTQIEVPLLEEAPYVSLTLDWLAHNGIRLEHDGLRHFRVPGGQRFRPFTRRIPADFSSATFFLAAGAMPGNEVLCRGLDPGDTQPDKAVVGFLQEFGARVRTDAEGITVAAGNLRGVELDLNDCPDSLPMLAALACLGTGETRLVNVAHARIKETDRIAVMAAELQKLGADVSERPDGLVIRPAQLSAGTVDGHHDHRVVMALAVLATQLPGPTRIVGAEAAAVTYPAFVDHLQGLGADLEQEG